MSDCAFCVPKQGLKSYEEVLAHLHGLGLFTVDMGLSRMEQALQKLGLTRFPCPAVQVVGTNGKGSTSTFLHSLAQAHGFRTGLYTSPHFVSPTERIRMGHRLLPENAWPGLANRALAVEPKLTYFELMTVMAALAFADAEPDLLIFEAGLGGRYDATSALPLDMTCFVPIGLDHTQILGPTVAAIAADKADAMHKGMRCALTAPQPDEAWQALDSKSRDLGLKLYDSSNSRSGHEVPPHLAGLLSLADTLPLGLYGPYQRINARTALAAWLIICDQQGWQTDEKRIRKGLEHAFIPGRLQYVEAHDGYPAFLLDGAHNVHGMKALTGALQPGGIYPEGVKLSAVIFSCLGDKEPDQLVPELCATLDRIAPDVPMYIPLIGDNPRAAKAADLVKLAGPRAGEVASLRDAVEKVRKDHVEGTVLVCGSLYLLSEFFTLFPLALDTRGTMPDVQS